MQLNHINCESTDSESDTDDAISINMIHVENYYEPIIYEQPILSHIYQNNDQFLLNYYIRPISSNNTIDKIVEEITEEKPTECSRTNNLYQNTPKEPHLPKEKNLDNPLLLEGPKFKKKLQTTDLETDFLIESGAESNIINIPTWNEIEMLHPKLLPFKRTSRLATAQGSTITNYEKREQNKLMSKPFKQTFHITDIKHNIIGIPFITKYIPTINILNSRIHIKDKYTRTKNTALFFFGRINKQQPLFSKFYPIYNQERKHLKPLAGYIYNFRSRCWRLSGVDPMYKDTL